MQEWDRKMKKTLAFFSVSIKNFSAYRGATYVYFATSLFHIGVALFVWLAAENQVFPSYTKAELVGYYLVLLFVNWFVNWSMFTSVYRDIYSGDIQKDLIRPYSYFAAGFGQAAGFKLFSSITFLVGVIFIYYVFLLFKAPISIPPLSLERLPFFLLSLAFAIVLNYSFRFVLSILAFWLTEIQFVDYAYYTIFPFLSGDIFPITFLPPIVQEFNRFLPFRYQLSFPIEILFHKVSGSEMYFGFGVSVVWLVVFYALYKYIWRKGSRAYMAFGH